MQGSASRRRVARGSPAAPISTSDMSSGQQRGRHEENFSREPSVTSSRSENYWRRGNSTPSTDRTVTTVECTHRATTWCPGSMWSHVSDADTHFTGDRDGCVRINARARERRRLHIDAQSNKQTLDRNNNNKVKREELAIGLYQQFNPIDTREEFRTAYNVTPVTPPVNNDFEEFHKAANNYLTVINKHYQFRSESSSSDEENKHPLIQLVKYDHCLHKEPAEEVTDKPLAYRTTQVITERTRNDTEKRIVWIYSYKNRHLFTDVDGDARVQRSSGDSDESTLKQLDTKLEDIRPLWDKNYDTQTCRSPRYPNTSCPIYIPSLNLPSAKHSLEPVEEGVETTKSEQSQDSIVKNLVNQHISEETLRSVNQWIDSNDVPSAPHLPENVPNEQYTMLNEDLRLDLSKESEPESTVHVPRIRLTARTGEDDSQIIGRVDDSVEDVKWISEKLCVDVFESVETGVCEARARETGVAEGRALRLGNTPCPGDDASCRLFAKSLMALRSSPWSVYYEPGSPRASDAFEISLGNTDVGQSGRVWNALAQWFCKCF